MGLEALARSGLVHMPGCFAKAVFSPRTQKDGGGWHKKSGREGVFCTSKPLQTGLLLLWDLGSPDRQLLLGSGRAKADGNMRLDSLSEAFTLLGCVRLEGRIDVCPFPHVTVHNRLTQSKC